MKKGISGLVCLLVFTISVYSQSSLNKKYDCYIIEPDTLKVTLLKIPYHSVIVTDERPDTLKAGYYYPNEKTRGIQRVCFQNGLKSYVSSFLDAYFQYNTDATNTILVCIKKLWFGTYDTTDVKENKLTIRTRKLFLKAEVYLNSGNCYYPLYRFDSTLNMGEMPGKSPSFVLEAALKAATRKLVTNDHSGHQSLRCLSRQQIDSFNTQHKTYSVLAEKVAKKGVYMTLAQFKKNQPAFTEFNLKFNRATDIVSIPGKERQDSVVNAWGVSDGTKMYVRMGQNYFELLKSGNNYDFEGFDTYFRSSPGNMYTTPVGVMIVNLITAKANRSKPFQLNLETGEIY